MSTIYYVVGTVVHWTAWTLAIIFMADFICGFVHWLEDNYGQEDTPIVGAAIIAPNRLHHATIIAGCVTHITAPLPTGLIPFWTNRGSGEAWSFAFTR